MTWRPQSPEYAFERLLEPVFTVRQLARVRGHPLSHPCVLSAPAVAQAAVQVDGKKAPPKTVPGTSKSQNVGTNPHRRLSRRLRSQPTAVKVCSVPYRWSAI